MNRGRRPSKPLLPRRRTGLRRWRLPLLGVLALFVVAGGWWFLRGSRPAAPYRAERQEYAPVSGPLKFPEEFQQAPTDIRELYEFAARRPDVLHYVPCFCGCWRQGHESAYDCFIDDVEPDGTVDIDDMGYT